MAEPDLGLTPASKSLRSRMLRGATAQAFSQGITTVTRLAEVPLFLFFWGAAYYGEWLILSAIPAYLAMSDMGFTSAATRDMAMRVAAGKRSQALAVFQSTLVLVFALSTLLLALLVALSFLVPFEGWLNVTQIKPAAIPLVIVLLGLSIIVRLYSHLVFGGLYCDGRYAAGIFLLALARLFEFLMMMLAIVMGWDVVGAAAGILVGSLGGAVLMVWVLRRQVPWVRFGIRFASRRVAKKLLAPSVASTAFPVGQALNHQGTRVLIAATLGPTAVTAFVTMRTLTRLLPQIVYSWARIFQPEMGIALGKRDYALLRRLSRRCIQIALWTTGCVSLALWSVHGPLLDLWTTGKIESDPLLIGLLLAVALTEALWQAAALPVFAANQHAKIALRFLVLNAAALVAIYFLASTFFSYGVALSLLIAEVAMLIAILPAATRVTHDQVPHLMKSVCPPPVFLIGEIRRVLTPR